VSLDPVEQIVVRYLIDYGPRTGENILAEVSSKRAVIEADVDEALARLASQGLADARIQFTGEQSQTLYVATKRAGKLKGHIPLEPQTVMDFYI